MSHLHLRVHRPVSPGWLGPLLLCLLVTLLSRGATSAPKIYLEHVEPHWFSDSQKFWYRKDLPADAREFIVVETASTNSSPRRRPAFDHARVAAELSKRTGKTADAARLPFTALEFGVDGKSVTLRSDEATWELDLDSYELTDRSAGATSDGGLPLLPGPRPSRRTGPESSILFDNRIGAEVALFWVSDDGERRAYGVLKPKETRRQHTFGGHVWLAVRNGEVIASFEAADTPQRAIIDGRAAEGPRENREGRSGRGRRSESSATAAAPQLAVRSPDGAREAFVRDHNLWIRVVTNGVESQLSFDGNPGLSFRKDTQRSRLMGMNYDEPEAPTSLPEVFWSPDSRKLAALQTRSVPERRVQLIESSPKDQLQPKLASYPYLKAGDEIPVSIPRLFDVLDSHEFSYSHELIANPWSLDEFRWAPDNSSLTFLYNQRGHQVMRVLALQLPAAEAAPGTSARLSVLVDEVCPTFFDYSNKTFLQHLDATHELVWMSERDGWNHLYLIDTTNGRVKNPITRGEWVVRGVDKVDAEKRQVWFKASGIRPGQDPYHVHLARVNLDGSGLVILTEGDGTHEIQWSPDRRHFIDTWSRVDQPPVHELRRAEDGTLVSELEKADATEVIRARGRFPERFTAKGRDGVTDIWGIVHRPRDFDPSRHYAVIENIYAGPHGQHVPKSFRATYRHQEEIADRGFVVVQIDGMGTNWRSKKFHDVAWRNIVDGGFPDRIAWMKAAAARYPELDLTQVGIYGGSAGGQNAVAALLTHGEFYRAGVADCGCHDNRMDKIWWNEAWMGWPVGPHYAAQSNVTLARHLAGKLMLFVGELDRNVDPASTTQLVNALIKADKDFDFVLVPGAGHGSAESDYGRRRRADFFVHHLKGGQETSSAGSAAPPPNQSR